MKVISVLGATGSVGTQALDVAAARGYRVDFLTADKNVSALEKMARRHQPRMVAMADENAARALSLALSDTDITVLSGSEGILEGIQNSCAETFVNSILGEAGLLPTLKVIESGRRLALANKESLVIAGELVMECAKSHHAEILPVDSEHCAIHQCLTAGQHSEIRRLLLTASGGPFFGYTQEQLRSVTLAETLAHPTWKMGKKITVDSATLMNKGFEVIEASHLFGIDADRIEVVVHRESIIHSAVEYIDNAVIAELSVPDMRMCVEYAVDYPNRSVSCTEPLDLFSVGKLTFHRPDTEAFPLLALAKRAAAMGGGMGAVLNAADEIAVGAHLSGKLPFYQIAHVVTKTFESMTDAQKINTLDELLLCDNEARQRAAALIK